MSRSVALALPLFTLALGCGASSPEPCSIVEAAPPPERAEVRLSWLDVGPARMPVVRAWFGDRAVRLLVDTGAGGHFLEHGTAWRLGLQARSLGTGITDSGTPVTLQLGAVAYGAGGEETHVTILDAPPLRIGLRNVQGDGGWFSAEVPWMPLVGLAGFLSPQLASPDDAAVELDLRAATMRVLAPDEAARILAPAPGWTPMESLGVGPFGAAKFAVEAEVDGIPARMLVDTGAARQAIYAGPAVARLDARPAAPERVGSVDGVRSVDVVEGVTIALSRWRGDGTLQRAGASAGAVPGVDGRLGMEVLQHCVVVLSRERGALRCEP